LTLGERKKILKIQASGWRCNLAGLGLQPRRARRATSQPMKGLSGVWPGLSGPIFDNGETMDTQHHAAKALEAVEFVQKLLGGVLLASHIVSEQLRQLYSTPEGKAAIVAAGADLYAVTETLDQLDHDAVRGLVELGGGSVQLPFGAVELAGLANAPAEIQSTIDNSKALVCALQSLAELPSGTTPPSLPDASSVKSLLDGALTLDGLTPENGEEAP
jgi:hypothetical protein